jgi:hypothetical protein
MMTLIGVLLIAVGVWLILRVMNPPPLRLPHNPQAEIERELQRLDQRREH